MKAERSLSGSNNIFYLVLAFFFAVYAPFLYGQGSAGTMKGNDGKIYKTVRIENQVWMAENLKETKYRNGDAISKVTVNRQWIKLTTGAYCEYDNNESYGLVFGYLYNMFAVDDSRGISPAGWRVPAEEDWEILAEFLGGRSAAGGKMKKAGTSYWRRPNTGATNLSGFSALPGGYRGSQMGGFTRLGYHAVFWSADKLQSGSPLGRNLSEKSGTLGLHLADRQDGYSVRLLME